MVDSNSNVSKAAFERSGRAGAGDVIEIPTMNPNHISIVQRLVTATVLSVALLGAAGAEQQRSMLPDWELDSVDGRTWRFHADTAGRPAVVMFWATWCPYCRALFPHIEAVRRDYESRGVSFFALNIWEDSDPQAYFAEHGYGMTLVLAADLVAEDYAVAGTPAVFVAGGDHRLLYQRRRSERPEDVERALRATLDQVLGGEAP